MSDALTPQPALPSRRRRASCRCLAAAAALSVGCIGVSQAGILDDIRNYDLNDYALGVAVSASQNPYLGSDNSSVVYPYLTSFRHSAFTDDWLLVRGENLGLRTVTDSGWEFGLIGRVQTLGQGVSDNTALAGINDRNWTVEAGPLLGWRGWPVHMQFRSYWEIPQRHDGNTSELEFSVPMEFARGYAVPAVKVSYLDDAYSAYYFGVTASESTPSRPVYQPGSATNVWAGLYLAYEIAPRWLLKTSLGFEQLDSAIKASPLIDRGEIWSGTVGLAYNADLFNARDYDGAGAERVVEIRAGAFRSSADTTIRIAPSNGQEGVTVDLEDLLGVADEETVLQLDAAVRLGHYHRLQLGYLRFDRRSLTTTARDIEIGDTLYPAGTEVSTDIESLLVRLNYSYSLMRDDQKELGVVAGISHFRLETDISESTSGQSETLSAEAPLPTIGVFGSVNLGDHWRLGADINFFALDFDRYDGVMTYLRLGLERDFGDIVSAGIGYDHYRLQLESRDSDVGGRFSIRYQGPRLYLGVAF